MADCAPKKMDFDISDPIFERHASFCSIFSAPIRLRILWLLRDGEQSVGYLSDSLQTSMANVSQHLRTMRNQGALLTRKEGKQVYYRISNEKFVRGAGLIREGLIENLEEEGRSAADWVK
ncbi:MAG: helix-turn-helix transcriptional regulator [Deltaproteobacteria bacterium]|nr:helix-turn-helix transcriptional regulator [Deltaproteobacteria bacterium]MBN2672745.1 helix-turn-helix transcriptional regulator [Deltaproteobacteria bacterium]